jgi:hypothetical protein
MASGAGPDQIIDHTETNYAFANTNLVFLSAPCGLTASASGSSHSYKHFNTDGFARARFVIYVRLKSGSFSGDFALRINGVLVKCAICRLPQNQWVALAFNMPIGSNVLVEMCGVGFPESTFVDDVWVIAK